MILRYIKAVNTGHSGGNDGAENDEWNHNSSNIDGTVFHFVFHLYVIFSLGY